MNRETTVISLLVAALFLGGLAVEDDQLLVRELNGMTAYRWGRGSLYNP